MSPSVAPAATRTRSATGGARRTRRWAYAVCAVVLLAAILLSLTVGATTVAPLDALRTVFGGHGSQDAIVHSRMDRTIIGLLTGAAVAMSGAALQGLTRNPLADPGLLGINAGAALAVVAGLVTGLAGGQLSYVLLALVGGSVAAAVGYVVASLGHGGASPITLALTGAAVTAACTSISSGLLVGNQRALDVFRFWQVGSIGGRDLGILPITLPFLAIGALIVLLSGRALDALALGEDLAAALGQRIWLVRLTIAGGAVLLAASATSIAGPIAFVGLVVPHLVRLLCGTAHTRLIVCSALLGPALLLAADTLGRIIDPPGEVSAGILTALLGVPTLIVLLRRRVVAL